MNVNMIKFDFLNATTNETIIEKRYRLRYV